MGLRRTLRRHPCRTVPVFLALAIFLATAVIYRTPMLDTKQINGSMNMAEVVEGDEFVYNAQLEAQLVPKEQKNQIKNDKEDKQQQEQAQTSHRQQQLQEGPPPNLKSYLDPHGDHFRLYDVNQKKIHVYSAFYDDRTKPPKVRVNLAAPYSWRTDRGSTFKCAVLTADGQIKSTKAKLTVHREHFSLPYVSYFFDCQTGAGNFTKVIATSTKEADRIHTSKDMTAFETPPPKGILPLPVIYFGQKEKEEEYANSMAVCIKPMHYKWNRALWLIEFVEFYKLLGATHFVFYNDTMGPDVERVLKYYANSGEATIMRWNLQLKTQKEIRTEAQFLALNECNLRLVNKFNYVAMVDVDEFLIPFTQPSKPGELPNLSKFISDYEVGKASKNSNSKKGVKSSSGKGVKSSSAKGGSWVFRNTFFYLYWPNDTTVMSDEGLAKQVFPEFSLVQKPGSANTTVRPYLLTQTKTRRVSKPHDPGTRSKFVAMPHATDLVGNHKIWKHLPGYVRKDLQPHEGLSFHYRICEFGGWACLKNPSEIDRTAQKWAPALLPAVKKSCDEIFSGPCPIAPPLGSPW